MWGKSYPVNIRLYVSQIICGYKATPDEASDELTNVNPEDRSTDVSGGEKSAPLINVTKLAKFVVVDEDASDSNDDLPIGVIDYYIRNQKLYLKSAEKSPFAEWTTSLYLLCTSFFKILSNEIREKDVPKHLRLRAIACTVAVPTVALMGVLMPFASYYFNRIVGDLDCWMNGFDNNDIATCTPADRQTRSSRCFAIDLQPYGFIGQNPNDSGDINIYNMGDIDPNSCLPIIINDLCNKFWP